jgi:hypothetical protein
MSSALLEVGVRGRGGKPVPDEEGEVLGAMEWRVESGGGQQQWGDGSVFSLSRIHLHYAGRRLLNNCHNYDL